MKRKLWLLAMVAAVLLSAAPLLADGDFYVVVAGGGVGTKITSVPYEIKNSGFYYLTGNLTYSGAGHGITVSSDDVTLDLMGFGLKGPGSNGSNYGIYMNGQQNVEIRNGTLRGWFVGILGDGAGTRHRAINVRVEDCIGGILFMGSIGQFLVKGCMVNATHHSHGIYLQGGNAIGNVVTNAAFGIHLFAGGNVIGNSVVTPMGYFGIYINTSDPALVTQNTVSGAGTHFVGGGATVNVANAGF